jgi:hypothetical protein
MNDARINPSPRPPQGTGVLPQILAVAAMLVIAGFVLYGR